MTGFDNADKNTYPILTYDRFHPYVRCVGLACGLYQQTAHKAYDHRMLCVIEGNGIIEVEGKEYASDTGDVFIIPPGISYRVAEGVERQIIVINFDLTHDHSHINTPVISVYAELFDSGKIIEIYDLTHFLGKSGFVKKQVSSEGIHLCEAVLSAYKEKRDELGNVYINSLFAQLFCFLSEEKPKKYINATAKEIYDYITENFHLPITLADVSKHFHFHPTYVNRLIKKYYGTSIKQLLLKCRFDKAVYLIDNTDMTIKEVANAVGFSNPQYFSEAFYTHFGVYPSSYRK